MSATGESLGTVLATAPAAVPLPAGASANGSLARGRHG
jgi:hypothetical protein